MIRLLFLLLFSFITSSSYAASCDVIFPKKTVYFGVNVGGGSTEWKYLVDTTDHSFSALASLPTAVTEGGPSWGAVFGYDVNKNFAIEAQYMQFANATIHFSIYSTYAVNPPRITSMISKTSAYSLSGKFLAQLAHTHLRAFAAVGGGLVERSDILYSGSCMTPYLSSGVVYSFNQHWMMETGFQYYTGFGVSELKPVNNYIPFAWDAYARLAYQI